MKRIVRYILLGLTLSVLATSLSGCESPLKPMTQFWGTLRFTSQFQKHVWITTNAAVAFDRVMNPGENWEAYLTGSQLYTLNWSYTDGTHKGSFDFRPNSFQKPDAGYDVYKMYWYLELGDNGVVTFQARAKPAPADQP